MIEIGVGLNTRHERLDNGRANWIELDLPDSMVLRRKFFADTERRHMMSANVLDTGWYKDIAAYPPPYCFVAEAVIIYLDNSEAERAMSTLAKHFPGAWLVTDTTSSAMVYGQDKHDAMKTMPKASWFRWRCDEPAALSSWGLHLRHSHTFLDVSSEIRDAMPLSYRLIFRLFPWMIRRKLRGYRINRFELKPSQWRCPP